MSEERSDERGGDPSRSRSAERSAKRPVTKRPGPKQAVKKQAVKKQAVKKQAVKKQAVKKQAVKKVSTRPAAKVPAVQGQAGAAATSGQPSTKRPATKRPAAKRPSTKRPVKRPTGKRPANRPATPPSPAKRAAGATATGRRTGAPSTAPASPPSLADRLLEPVDTSGRKTLLGLLWVVSLAAALWIGVLALGTLFGLVGAVAGLQGARAWRRRGWPVSRTVAGLTPLLAGVAAGIGNGAAGAVLLVGVGATVVTSVVHARRVRILDTAGSTLRSWLPAAVTAVSVVAVSRVSLQAAVGMLVLSLSYDVGAYVWGAGVHRPLATRLAGIATVLVTTFALGVVHMVLELRPFDSSAAVWIFGGLAAACCPLGQMVVSASLPTARDTAPALRRLDSLVVTAPAWAMALWSSLG